jgi:hypothetical protein
VSRRRNETDLEASAGNLEPGRAKRTSDLVDGVELGELQFLGVSAMPGGHERAAGVHAEPGPLTVAVQAWSLFSPRALLVVVSGDFGPSALPGVYLKKGGRGIEPLNPSNQRRSPIRWADERLAIC